LGDLVDRVYTNSSGFMRLAGELHGRLRTSLRARLIAFQSRVLPGSTESIRADSAGSVFDLGIDGSEFSEALATVPPAALPNAVTKI
jgi:hypothetical protein